MSICPAPFHIQYDSGCACIRIVIDTTDVSDSPFNLTTAWTGTVGPEYSGEVGYQEDPLPGTSNARVLFSSMGVYTTAGSNVLTPCEVTSFNDDPTHMGGPNPYGCSSFDIYAQ
jgi:hypothetical protein